MNGLDILFLIILAVVVLRGLFRGMVKEIASILGIIVSFFLANQYHHLILPYLESVMNSNEYARIISYALVFISCFLCIFFISLLFRKFLKLLMLSWVDTLAGAGFGLLKGALICSLILFVLTTFLRPDTPLLTTSQLAPHLHLFTKSLGSLLPNDIQGEFKNKSQDLEKFWDKHLAPKQSQSKNT